MDIVDKGVDSKTHILLEYWDFYEKNIEAVWYLLEWITWDSFDFEKASCISRYSFPDPCAFYCRSYYAPFWCDLCSSFDHDINSCPYYAYYDQFNFDRFDLTSLWDNTDFSYPYMIHPWL